MEKDQYIVAFEIGSSKIVGAIAEKSPNGLLSVEHLVEEKLTNCVRYGVVQNVENVKACISRIVAELEHRIDGKITQVYVGVSGRSLHSHQSEINRGLDSEKAITIETIDSIIHDASRTPVKDYETIDIVPRSYYVDRTRTDNPVGIFGSSIKINANLIVAKPTLRLNLDRVMKDFPFAVKGSIITPLAVGEEILSNDEKTVGCMLVDMGAETTTVSIYKENALVHLVTIPLGGRNITRDIVNGLQVLEDQAENVKRNITTPFDAKHVESVVIEGIEASDAVNYISARANEIIANIKQQIEVAGSGTTVRNIVLIGGGAHLNGLAHKLEEEINKTMVRQGQYPQALNITNHHINKMEYIEVFSLLSKAAKQMRPGETCVERTNYHDGPIIHTSGTENNVNKEAPGRTTETTTTNTEEPKRTKRPGWWEKFAKKAGEFLKEDDEDNL